MSLILEALRKSEAERRLGSAPDVLSAMPVMRVSAPRARWPLAVTAVVGALVVATAVIWWSQRFAAPSSASGATSESAQPKPAPLPPIVQAPPAIPAAAPPPRAAPREAQHPAAAVPAMPPVTSPTQSTPLAAPAPALAATTPVAAPTQPSATNAEPALLSLGDLSADERAGLPAFKVSMHVYADDPARRFLIVDGQRVGEGARLAEGVVLVHIRRDGAEIDLRGRRVLLPKP